MSPNHRIPLNIIATYGRRKDALVCGLFVSLLVLAWCGLEDLERFVSWVEIVVNRV